MNILDLATKFEATLEFNGDGVHYFDYGLTLKYDKVDETITLTSFEIEEMLIGLDQLKKILEKGI